MVFYFFIPAGHTTHLKLYVLQNTFEAVGHWQTFAFI
jgi:hypothetical protein